MHSTTQTEAALIQSMTRITVPYRKALEILRQNADRNSPQAATSVRPGFDDVCVRLRPSMEMIAAYEQELAPLRAAWNGRKQPATSELKLLIDEHSALLSELIELLNGVEQTMLTSRQQLGPQVDESQRRTVMRQAYTIQR